MSFDELPPGSTPPHMEDAASSTAQEPSGQDAPPATPARRRRAKAAGTDAASPAVPTENLLEKPARTPRPRRKLAADVVNSADTAALAEVPTETTAPDTPTPVKAAPRRRIGKVVAPPVIAEIPVEPLPEQPESVPEIAAVEAANAVTTTAPARRRRRGVKDVPPLTEPEIIEAPPAVPEPVAAPPQSRRRRSGQSRLKPTEVTPTVDSTPTETVDLPEPAGADDVIEPVPSIIPGMERQARRRRSSRARRGTPVLETTEIQPDAIAPAVEADLQEPVDSESDMSPAGRSRRRRSRRSIPVAVVEEVEPEPVSTVYSKPAVDLHSGAHLISRNGMPEIHLDGVVHAPILFFGNVEEQDNRERVLAEVRRAAGAGVHIHSTLIELPCPTTEGSPALIVAAERLSALLAADPDGYVIPRVVILPGRGWKRANPSEISLYSDGSNGDPSIGSDRFWTEAEASLELLVAHLNSQEWRGRVAGYHLERGEWFQPVTQGYDRCAANRDSFREWLKEKYRNNVILLRAAWYNGDVQFHTADIPALPTKTVPQRAFYEPRRERAIIDFHEYTSDITARRLIALATTVKKAADHKALVSVCYGYTFEFGHTFSGHLSLGLLEASEAIDLICGPPSYRDRNPGGAASMPSPIDSPPLHSKLWLSEDDTKTFLAPAVQDPEDFNLRLESRAATEHAQQRALGRTVSHTTGIGFMDLWGEGWLDDDLVWEQLKAFVSRYSEQLRKKEHPRIPEVVVLVDEKSLMHVQRGEQFLRRITAAARDSLQRAGVSFGVYLQSDLLSPAFPDASKLYLFLTPYRLTAEQRAAIKEKLQKGNKTLAWLYAPGSCEERPAVGGALEETATGAIGIALRQQEWNSEVGSRVVDTHHALTDRLQGREIGVRERLNPSFYVDDPDATVVAEYQGSGLPSVAAKNCGDWKSVFIGDPVLPLDLLRGICKYAGVHVWTPMGEDVIDIGNGHVTIHAIKDGQRTIRLPDATGLYDVTESRHVADEIREHRFHMRQGETHCFCVGSAERFLAIGLPNVHVPPAGRPRIVVPPLPERESKREPAPRPKPQNSDLETLEAVLNMDISALSGIDLDSLPDDPIDFIYSDVSGEAGELDGAETEVAGEVVAGGRRRRRRGGRGRGRRRSTETDASAPGSTASSTTPTDGVANADFSTDGVSGNLDESVNVWPTQMESGKDTPDAESTAFHEGDEGF